MQSEANAPKPVLWIRILIGSDRHHFAGSGSGTTYLIDTCRLILHGSGSADQRMSVHGCGHTALLSGPAPFTWVPLWFM
jgi:hypothetical protein